MTHIAVPTAYNLSFHLNPGLFAATDSQASPSFTGSAQISVLTATPTTCFLLHAAGLEFSGIEISAGLGPGGKQVYDCACGAAPHCKLRRCSDMVLPMQQCVPRAPSPCLGEMCAGHPWAVDGSRGLDKETGRPGVLARRLHMHASV